MFIRSSSLSKQFKDKNKLLCSIQNLFAVNFSKALSQVDFVRLTDDEAKKDITEKIDKELKLIQGFDLQVITYSKIEWRNQKVIGSEAFIR